MGNAEPSLAIGHGVWCQRQRSNPSSVDSLYTWIDPVDEVDDPKHDDSSDAEPFRTLSDASQTFASYMLQTECCKSNSAELDVDGKPSGLSGIGSTQCAEQRDARAVPPPLQRMLDDADRMFCCDAGTTQTKVHEPLHGFPLATSTLGSSDGDIDTELSIAWRMSRSR